MPFLLQEVIKSDEKVLGQGAFGKVYRVFDAKSNKNIAIKII